MPPCFQQVRDQVGAQSSKAWASKPAPRAIQLQHRRNTCLKAVVGWENSYGFIQCLIVQDVIWNLQYRHTYMPVMSSTGRFMARVTLSQQPQRLQLLLLCTCCVTRRDGAAVLPDTRAEPVVLDFWAAAALRPVKRLGCIVGALVEASGCTSTASASCIRVLQSFRALITDVH